MIRKVETGVLSVTRQTFNFTLCLTGWNDGSSSSSHRDTQSHRSSSGIRVTITQFHRHSNSTTSTPCHTTACCKGVHSRHLLRGRSARWALLPPVNQHCTRPEEDDKDGNGVERANADANSLAYIGRVGRIIEGLINDQVAGSCGCGCCGGSCGYGWRKRGRRLR